MLRYLLEGGEVVQEELDDLLELVSLLDGLGILGLIFCLFLLELQKVARLEAQLLGQLPLIFGTHLLRLTQGCGLGSQPRT